MNTHIVILALFLLCLHLVHPVNARTNPDSLIRQTIFNYMEGTNEHDALRVERAFTKNSVIFVAREGEALTFPASFFIERVKNGQSGGDTDRSITVNRIDKLDSLAASAWVEARSENQNRLYKHILSLVNDNGTWVIASVIIHISPLN